MTDLITRLRSKPYDLDKQEAADALERRMDEVADLKMSVVAFGAIHAVNWAKDGGYPKGSLHPDHYDLLERCGARMVAFTRISLPPKDE